MKLFNASVSKINAELKQGDNRWRGRACARRKPYQVPVAG
jgi:hypothetical protein